MFAIFAVAVLRPDEYPSQSVKFGGSVFVFPRSQKKATTLYPSDCKEFCYEVATLRRLQICQRNIVMRLRRFCRSVFVALKLPKKSNNPVCLGWLGNSPEFAMTFSYVCNVCDFLMCLTLVI